MTRSRRYYVTLPPISPTIAPNPISYVVEHALAAAFTCSESLPNMASTTFRISARTVNATTVEKISLKRGVRSDLPSEVRMLTWSGHPLASEIGRGAGGAVGRWGPYSVAWLVARSAGGVPASREDAPARKVSALT